MPSNTPNFSFNLPGVNDPVDADLWGGQLNSNWTSADTLLSGVVGSGGQTIVGSASTLTISAGAVTATGSSHLIDTEGMAATDDLDTINGGVDGQLLVVSQADAARTVVLRDGTGNIETPTGVDISMDGGLDSFVFLKYDGSAWQVVASTQFASQAEAEAGTDNAKLMTPLRVQQHYDAQTIPNPVYNREVFTSSGTWVRPAGVDQVKVTVTGGGGGGSEGHGGNDGSDGGSSSFVGDTTVTANGGSGGESSSLSTTAASFDICAGGSGGSGGSGGDTAISGGDGGIGFRRRTNEPPSSVEAMAFPGTGGASYFGGGASMRSTYSGTVGSTVSGQNAESFGSGGGGGFQRSTVGGDALSGSGGGAGETRIGSVSVSANASVTVGSGGSGGSGTGSVVDGGDGADGVVIVEWWTSS